MPFWMIGLTVVGNPAATVMTSSPRRSRWSPSSRWVSAVMASRFADEPELRRSAQPRPSARANSGSNVVWLCAAANRMSSAAETRATRSSSSSTAPEGSSAFCPGTKPPGPFSWWYLRTISRMDSRVSLICTPSVAVSDAPRPQRLRATLGHRLREQVAVGSGRACRHPHVAQRVGHATPGFPTQCGTGGRDVHLLPLDSGTARGVGLPDLLDEGRHAARRDEFVHQRAYADRRATADVHHRAADLSRRGGGHRVGDVAYVDEVPQGAQRSQAQHGFAVPACGGGKLLRHPAEQAL